MLTAAEGAFEGAFDTSPGPGVEASEPLLTLGRPRSLYADRLARGAFHLSLDSSCRKLTVDVRRPRSFGALGVPGLMDDLLGKGMALTACQSTI